MNEPSCRSKPALVFAGSALIVLGLAPLKVYGFDSLAAAGVGMGLLMAFAIFVLGCGLGGGILQVGLSVHRSRARTLLSPLGALFLVAVTVLLFLFSSLDDYVKTDGGGPGPWSALQAPPR